MRKSTSKKRLAALTTLVCALISIPALSNGASTRVSTAAPMMTIAVANNASRDIYHLYLSPVDHDAWGPDLLTEATILRTGQTFTIAEASCTGNEIKVVAEDRQGCFIYVVLGCAEASAGWTITDAYPVDCGN
jgi:hypothetical protein